MSLDNIEGEVSELKEKIDIIKDSFNDIMALVKGLKLRQEATEEILTLRDVISSSEIDALEDAIKEDMFS